MVIRPSTTGPVAASPDEAVVPRRQRVRASTIEEIKATARRLMAEQGTADVRFTDIARAMGMTGPALYRYFGDRDALLTALLVDGYNDLADRLTAGAREPGSPQVWRRFTGIAAAYRAWAKADHVRYALVFGMPIPGYEAPVDGETTMAAKRGMSALAEVLADAHARGELGSPLVAIRSRALGEHLSQPGLLTDVPAELHQAMMHAWMAMHGFVSLEIFGHLDMVPPQARDDLYDAQVRLSALAVGVRPPD